MSEKEEKENLKKEPASSSEKNKEESVDEIKRLEGDEIKRYMVSGDAHGEMLDKKMIIPEEEVLFDNELFNTEKIDQDVVKTEETEEKKDEENLQAPAEHIPGGNKDEKITPIIVKDEIKFEDFEEEFETIDSQGLNSGALVQDSLLKRAYPKIAGLFLILLLVFLGISIALLISQLYNWQLPEILSILLEFIRDL